MEWFAIWWSHYYPGLRYTLVLNALGLGFMVRAWQGDLHVLRYTTRVPRWFLLAVGVVLQVPGAIYVAIGVWSASELGSVLPGAEFPPAGIR